MQDELDRVPADAIFYNEAFERVFDALHPDAPRLRAEIEQISVMTSASFKNPDQELKDRRYEIFKKWEEARSKTQTWFRNQLAMGELDFYQRDSVTGEKLRLHPDLFLSKYAFNRFSPDPPDPPVFCIKADFEKWRSDIIEKIGVPKDVTKRVGGRKPDFDWEDIELFVCKTMDEKGPFDKGWQGWRSQADLHRLICEDLQSRNKRVPQNSVLYERVRRMISHWREKQSSSGN